MDLKTKSKRQIEYIEWGDAFSIDAWTPVEDAIDGDYELVESVGFLLSENDDSVTLCLNLREEAGIVSCVMTIPKGMIKSRRQISIDLASA
jgi:hypothetical protein